MMRSAANPRIQHDGTVKFETGGGVAPAFDARAVNLSKGGLFVNAPTLLAPGVRVDLQVSLRDGKSPVQATGEVVWVQDGAQDERGMALRFVDLPTDAESRIEKLVSLRARDATGTGARPARRELRIRLPSLPAPLRAVARDQTDRGLMLEAELPWLTLGSQIVAELSPDRAVEGTVRWVGLDLTRAGHARLRIFVEVAGDEPVQAPLESTADSVANFARPVKRKRRPILAALGVGGAMAIAAGSTALFMYARTPRTVLTLRPAESAAPSARVPALPPVVVAVPQEKTPAPAAATAAPAPAPAHGKRGHAVRKRKVE